MNDCIVKRCRASEENSGFIKYLGKYVCNKHWKDHCDGIIDLSKIVAGNSEQAEVSDMSEKKSVKKEKKAKGSRKDMTIAETKYGVCVVLKLKDCEKLGFKGSQKSREVIAFVRSKLGLPDRKAKE